VTAIFGGARMFVRVGVLLLLLSLSSAAQAEQRIALLIGNKDYKSGVGALVNPINDVRIVGAALSKVGFEIVGPLQNARRADILNAVIAFAGKLRAAGPDAIGLLYYSGHGMAAEGENYLIPVDIEEPSTDQLRVHGVRQSEILSTLRHDAPNAVHYLVLDACRNTLQVGRGGGKGFISIGEQSGVLIAYSTEPGQVALDIGTDSGPYAAALAAELVKPGLSDLIMFHNVRIAVMEKTRAQQVPWTEDGIQRRLRVEFGNRIPREVTSREREARNAWNAIKTTTNSIVLEKFIALYGDTFYGELARVRSEELKKRNNESGSRPIEAEGHRETTIASRGDAAEAWAEIKNTRNTNVLEAFVRSFGQSTYGDMARARLEELKKQVVVTALPMRPEAPEAVPACPNIVGTWNSWASGLFGKGDTTFYKDGRAIHSSTIGGWWRCENGNLLISWAGETPGTFKLSGKQIINTKTGSVGFSRD
jgi:hypothetical protein